VANGDRIGSPFERVRQSFKLLDAQTGASTGAWVTVPEGFVYRTFQSTSLEEGAADATIDIHVNNDENKPADATAGDVTVQLVLATPAAEKTHSYRHVKAVKNVGTTPIATTVIMVCEKPSR